MTGFEPATSASRTQRSTKLSYIPLMRPDFSGPITPVNDVGEIVLMSRGHLCFVSHFADFINGLSGLTAGLIVHGGCFEASSDPRGALVDRPINNTDAERSYCGNKVS